MSRGAGAQVQDLLQRSLQRREINLLPLPSSSRLAYYRPRRSPPGRGSAGPSRGSPRRPPLDCARRLPVWVGLVCRLLCFYIFERAFFLFRCEFGVDGEIKVVGVLYSETNDCVCVYRSVASLQNGMAALSL